MQFNLSRFSIYSMLNSSIILLILLIFTQHKTIIALPNKSINNTFVSGKEREKNIILKSESSELNAEKKINYFKEKYSSFVSNISPYLGYPRSRSRDGSLLLTNTRKWTSGFFPGLLWYLYQYTGDEKLLFKAQIWTKPIESQQYNKGTHDLGFIIFNSFGHGYNITGNSKYKQVILTAANSLASRYKPETGVIKSWDWNPNKSRCTHSTSWVYPVIIDNMMNLELLFWAAKNGGDPQYYNLAVNHAKKTAQNHIRADGSTYHVVDYNPINGDVIKKVTWQGWSNESVWARGQAWGLYGFTMTYRKTGNGEFLQVAEKLADFFVENLPKDKIPYWDFKVPTIPNTNKDTSAAAIAASGLLELSTLTEDKNKQKLYFQTAKQILIQLSSNNYLNSKIDRIPLLLHAVSNYSCNKEIDVSIIYGDYYYIEALMRYDTILKTGKISS